MLRLSSVSTADSGAREVCVCVVGTGSIGMRHLRVLASLPGIRTIAVPARAERVGAEELAPHHPVASLAAAVHAGATHAVIATDTGRHARDATTALASGCHVLIEKPLAASPAAATEILRASEAHDRAVYVACCLRFQRALRGLRASLTHVGRIHSVRIECQSYLPEWRPGADYRRGYAARADEGGVMRDLVHELDYATWLFGDPRSLVAKLRPGTTLGIEAEEAADLLWQVPHGPTVSMTLDYVTRVPRRRVRVYGADGDAEWDGIARSVMVARVRDEATTTVWAEDRDTMYVEQARAFLRSTVAGRPVNDIATVADGERAVRLIDAARRSDSERREVSL